MQNLRSPSSILEPPDAAPQDVAISNSAADYQMVGLDLARALTANADANTLPAGTRRLVFTFACYGLSHNHTDYTVCLCHA